MPVQEQLFAVRVAGRTRVRVRFPISSRDVAPIQRHALAELVLGRSCRRRVVGEPGATTWGRR